MQLNFKKLERNSSKKWAIAGFLTISMYLSFGYIRLWWNARSLCTFTSYASNHLRFVILRDFFRSVEKPIVSKNLAENSGTDFNPAQIGRGRNVTETEISFFNES